jgi:hypothetical protein
MIFLITMAGLDPAIQPPRVGAANNGIPVGFRMIHLLADAHCWMAGSSPAMVR